MRTTQGMSLPPVVLRMVPVGKIVRHPTAQRDAQPKKWRKKVGELNEYYLGVATLSRDGNGGYFAHDFGHRAAALLKVKGPSFEVPALVYDGVLTEQQSADLTHGLNSGMAISTAVGHRIKIKAKHADATVIEEQRVRLPRCRTVGAFYTIYRQHGRVVLKQTVDIAIRVWGQQADFPGTFLTGLARYVDEATPSGAALTTDIKRWKTGKRSPPQWLDRAKLRRARFAGNGSLSEHLRVLFRGSGRAG